MRDCGKLMQKHFNKKILQSVVIQALGPFLLLGLSVGIGRFLGAGAQGQFATSKALLDLLVALGSFGFPQSVVLAINRDGVSRSCLYRDAVRYSLVIAALFIPLFAALNYEQNTLLQTSLLFSISGACLVLNNIWRGILLTVDDGINFHLITIFPAVSVAFTVSITLVLLPNFDALTIAWAFAMAGLIALIFSFLTFPLQKVNGFEGARPDYPKLVANGADVFVQAVAMSIQTYFFLDFLGKSYGDAEAGYFSLALIAFQACLMPLQMVSPMVLNVWSKQSGDEPLIAGRPQHRLLIVAATGLVMLIVFFGPWMVRLILGESFDPAIPGVQIIFLAVLPALMTRIAGLRLAAVGCFRLNSLVAIIRLGAALMVLLTGVWWGEGLLSASTTAAVAWLMAEVVSAILAERLVRKRRLTAPI